MPGETRRTVLRAARLAARRSAGPAPAGGRAGRVHRVRNVVPRRADGRSRSAGARGRAGPSRGRPDGGGLARGRDAGHARGGRGVLRAEVARDGRGRLAARRARRRGRRRDARGRGLVVPHRELHVRGRGDRRAEGRGRVLAPGRGRGGAQALRAGAVAVEDPRCRRGARLADGAGGGAEASRGRLGLGRGASHRAAPPRPPGRSGRVGARLRARGRGPCRRARRATQSPRSRRSAARRLSCRPGIRRWTSSASSS